MTSDKKRAHSWRFEALGTSWEIVSDRPLDDELKHSIQKEIETFDASYSRFRKDSIIQMMAQKAGEYKLPECANQIFTFYDELFELTNGKVTPLIGDTLVSAGYDATYSLQEKNTISPVLNYKDILSRNGSQLTIKKPVTIDIGAVGKGYLVDRISETLVATGYSNFIVDGSGDMRVVGSQEENVGLENPFATEEVVGVMKLKNKALCASANNRRAWGNWHHIIDPDTSRPTNDIIATWVVADTAMLADGLATALFFTDPRKLSKKYNYEYMRMFANGSAEYSDYFAEGVF